MNINMKDCEQKHHKNLMFSLSEHLIQEYTDTGRSQSTNELGPKGFGGLAWGICSERWRHSDSPKIHPVWREQNQGVTACLCITESDIFLLSGIRHGKFKMSLWYCNACTDVYFINMYNVDGVTNGQTLFPLVNYHLTQFIKTWGILHVVFF